MPHAVQQHLREDHVKLRRVDLVVIFQSQRQRLGEQLQRSHTISIRCMNVPAVTAAMRTALKLAGDDHAVVLDGQIRLSRGLQEPPVVLVSFDHLLAEVVDLVDAAEVLQALIRLIERLRHLA